MRPGVREMVFSLKISREPGGKWSISLHIAVGPWLIV
jgi:hypothetical protein